VRILAIDFGKKRTGLAVTDMLRLTANPLVTIDTSELMKWLEDYLAKGEVDEVVVGKPTQMNGADSESAQYIRPFLDKFRQKWPDMRLAEYDERFTSTLAHRAMIEGGMKKKQRQDKKVVDRLAACIILEGYMEYLRMKI